MNYNKLIKLTFAISAAVFVMAVISLLVEILE